MDQEEMNKYARNTTADEWKKKKVGRFILVHRSVHKSRFWMCLFLFLVVACIALGDRRLISKSYCKYAVVNILSLHP